MRTVVAKFGGTSLADAQQIRKTGKIITSDPDRKYIVVSAPGKDFRKTGRLRIFCCAVTRRRQQARTMKRISPLCRRDSGKWLRSWNWI